MKKERLTMLEKIVKLRPCPFCGGEGRIWELPADSVDKRKAAAWCPKCGCSTPVVEYSWYCKEGENGAALVLANVWNRRSLKEAVKQVALALAEELSDFEGYREALSEAAKAKEHDATIANGRWADKAAMVLGKEFAALVKEARE